MTTTQSNPSDTRRRTVRGVSWFNLHIPTMGSDSNPTVWVSNVGFRTAQCGCRQQVLKVQP